MLFGIEPGAATPYVVSTAALVMVAAIAGWLPARRACQVHPAEALRSQ